jgi:hypothetical protein
LDRLENLFKPSVSGIEPELEPELQNLFKPSVSGMEPELEPELMGHGFTGGLCPLWQQSLGLIHEIVELFGN